MTASNLHVIEVHRSPEDDPYEKSARTKEVGEIRNVGLPTAMANAAYHQATGRVRDLPLSLDKLRLE